MDLPAIAGARGVDNGGVKGTGRRRPSNNFKSLADVREFSLYGGRIFPVNCLKGIKLHEPD